LLGAIAQSPLPLWMQRLKVWWALQKHPPYTDRLYDPVPTAAALKMPSYWIFGEQDSTMPTEWTIEALNKLQRQRKPVDYLIYPESGHGILRVEQLPDGNRRMLGYEPDYFKVQIDWLKRNNAPRTGLSTFERTP
jgi:dipeptidyl aminopeptidase/acylaminoacyl peptidase